MEALRIWAVCHDCQVMHPCRASSDQGRDFLFNHRGHAAELIAAPRGDGAPGERAARVVGELRPNANVNQAFGAATAFTKTHANLATSATAGWMSNGIDNSTNLYVDALVSLELAAVNTAPAGAQAVYLFAYSMTDGSNYSGTGAAAISGAEGTVTFPDVTAAQQNLPILGVVPYSTQNVAIISPAFSVARCFGGVLPQKWGVAMVNQSGMTVSVTNIYYQPVYYTVV